MKKHFRMLFTLVLTLLVASTISVSAASPNQSVAEMPWTSQRFLDGEDGILNMSTAFVGKYQVPMISYNLTGSHHIYQAHKATSAVPGNCGPNNAWYCNSWQDSSLVPGSVSPMATMQYIDTHTIRWAYSTGTYIRGAYIELMNDMTPVTDDFTDFIQLSKFGGILVDIPSLQVIGGHFRIAAIIRSGGDFPVYKLVYMYYIGNVNNDSCKTGGFAYQCDVIEESTSPYVLRSPSLQVADDATVGIAYYKYGTGIKYAYPHEPVFGWPSNCGPGGDTWRCISIYEGTGTGTVGTTVKLAMGEVSGERGIAYTYDDTMIPVTLMHADYVGGGGNCGWDYAYGGIGTYRWQCDQLVYYYYQNTQSFSLDIDPAGYSVIAYDYAPDDLSNRDLYIAYPNARVGDPDPGWTAQKIDGAPVYDVQTGALAALSLSDSGLGFISYLQEEPYELDDLKIAFQQFRSLLPMVKK